MDISTKGDVLFLKINGIIIEVYFDRWEKKHGNGTKFFATDGNLYDIKNSI